MRKQKTQVVMGEGGRVSSGALWKQRVKTLTTRKKSFLLLALLLIVAIIVTTALLVQKETKEKEAPSETLNTLELDKKVSGLVQDYKLAEAEKVMKSQAATNETVNGMLSLAGVQGNQSKYQEAIKTLEQAEKKFGMSYAIASQYAQIYTQKGDNAKALEYYKKALSMVQADNKQVANPKETIASLEKIVGALEKMKQ